MTPDCLACSQGITAEEYCAQNPGMWGCPGDTIHASSELLALQSLDPSLDDVICCDAIEPSCNACKQGITTEEYCAQNLSMRGCPGADEYCAQNPGT